MGKSQDQTNYGNENQVIEVSVVANKLQLQNGIIQFNNGNYQGAYVLFNDLAQKGDPESEYYLAQLFNKGLGVTMDRERALFWLKKSADHKYVEAQYSYAMTLLPNRLGTDPLFHEGMQYLAEAADQDHPLALRNYVDIVLMGYNETSAIKKAVQYHAKLQPLITDQYEMENHKKKEEQLRLLLAGERKREIERKIMNVIGTFSSILLVLGYLYLLGGTHPEEWRENVLLKVFPNAPEILATPFQKLRQILPSLTENGMVGLEILIVAYTFRSLYAAKQKSKINGALSSVSKLIVVTLVTWHVLLVIIEGQTFLEGIIYFIIAIIACRILGLILGRFVNTLSKIF